MQYFNKDNFAQDKFAGEENKENDDKMRAKTNQATNFLNSLGTGNGLDQSNALLVVMQRELVNKGNYQAIDGDCISVKKFLRDWNTDHLYHTLQSTNDFAYIQKFQSKIQDLLDKQKAS